MTARLNVNIDHVATVRQARRAPEPSVAAAALMCEDAGADGITVHLRGDRRHIQDEDVYTLRRVVEYCDGWFPRPGRGVEIRDQLARLHKMAEEKGRDPKTISTSPSM